MLGKIDWRHFILYLSLLVVVYYFFLGAKFFLPQWFSGLRGKKDATMPVSDKDVKAKQEKGKVLDDFKVLEDWIIRMKPVMAKAVKDGVDRIDLIEVIRVQVADVIRFKGTAFGIAINNALNRELRSHGIEPMSKVEEESVWR
jgi:hypothetical protein